MDDAAQLLAGLAATLCCWFVGRRSIGPERAWRLLIAAGMLGWTVGQGIWSYYRAFADIPIPSPSVADIGYLTLPVFVFAAMVMFAINANVHPTGRTPVLAARLRFGLAVVLDGLVLVGSMFIVAWATALGATVRADPPSALEFGVALAYPITDLILAVMIVLLVTVYRIAPPYRLQLSLLGLGLIAISASDSIFTYAVSTGAQTIAPINDAGFIAGPALIALAALAKAKTRTGGASENVVGTSLRANLVVPYLLAAAAGLLVVAKIASGRSLDNVEIYVGLLVIALALTRQLITLVDLAARRVSDRLIASSRETFRAAANQAVTAFELPVPQVVEVSLEDEIAEISSTLSQTVARLRRISQKAQAFESDVRELVTRAEAARVMAQLPEDDATKIITLVGSETERRLRAEIDKLAAEHNRQIDRFRDSSRKIAVWTFGGGVILGALANILVAVLLP